MIYTGILLFFVLEYVRPGTYYPVLTTLKLGTVVPLLVVMGTWMQQQGKPKSTEVEPSNRLFGILLGLILVSWVAAARKDWAFDIFTAVLGYLLIYWVICVQVRSFGRLKGIFAILMFVHILLVALTPAILLEPETRHYLASGTFLGDGNDFALSVVPTVSMALFLLSDTRNIFTKTFWSIILALLIFGVITTQSRGGTLGLIAMGGYYWWKSDRKGALGVLGAIAVAGVLLVAPQAYFNRMNTVSSGTIDGSAQGRIDAWQAGLNMALRNPLGVGAGNFGINYPRYSPTMQREPKTAHSCYFLVMGELGFAGFTVFVMLLYRNLKENARFLEKLKGRRNDEQVRCERLVSSLSASLIGFAVAGAFLSATYYPHIYVLVALNVVARGLASRAAAGEVQPAIPAPTLRTAARVTRRLNPQLAPGRPRVRPSAS